MKKILFYIALIVSLSPPGRTPSLRISVALVELAAKLIHEVPLEGIV